MKKTLETLEKYSPSVLRYAMAAVIIWFGVQQFIHTDSWTAYVPDSAVAMTGLKMTTLVYINATFELIFGLLLLIGVRTRIVAFLLGLHLLDIMYIVGYGEIGVRDFGLAVATLVVGMQGTDILCIDYKPKSAAPKQA